MRSLILRPLKRPFGEMTEELLAKIQVLSLEQLEALGEALLLSLEQLEALGEALLELRLRSLT